MKIIFTITFFFAIVLNGVKSFCQYSNLEFVENKGQWDVKVKFKGSLTNGAFFLTEKGFRVLLHNTDDVAQLSDMYHGILPIANKGKASSSDKREGNKREVVVHSHAYDVSFANASKPVFIPDKPLSTYNNYFIGNNPDKWKGGCKIFQAVTYKNLYPGIDVRYYTNEGKMKYDIVVNPSADISSLAVKYEGVDGLKVRDGQLIIKTSVGESKELAPYAYQIVQGFKKEVACSYKLIGNTVYYQLGDYDKSSMLVIDPTMVFSTFTGSTADNWGYTATYGADGSFFAGGIVFDDGTFPVSPGAYQTTYGGGMVEGGIGGYDIGIMKFNPTGTNRIYATYLGGANNEQPHSLIVDNKGNLVIAGRSNSTNFPLKGAGQLGVGGNYDIIIAKLNATGDTLLGSLKIGGSGMDGANIGPKYVDPQGLISIRRSYGDDARSEVIFEYNGDILLASNTQSSNYFTTPDAFQDTLAGMQDAVIIKASADLSRLIYSSYLGGRDDDAAFVIGVEPVSKKIYVGGNTASNNLPGDKTGVYQNTFGGVTDGFISILSPDAKTLLKTSYFGTADADMLYGLQFDKYGFPYITGVTNASWPVVNATFKQTGGKQFISKLRPDLSGFVYSTVFGTNSPDPNISPIAFLVDKCENVYVSGWGGNVNDLTGFISSGTTGLSITADALQPNTDNSDFYFFVLQRNAVAQLYGSFFGQQGGIGEHVDGGTSRFDKNGVIYQALCANCGSHNYPFPVTPGVWSPVNPSGNCNLAAVKIAFNLSGIVSSIKSSIQGSTQDTVGCVPLRVTFRDTLGEGKFYIWNFGDGSKNDTTATPTLNHLFNNVGTYKVALVAIDSAKCNIADTAYTLITVKSAKAAVAYTYKKVLPCDSIKYVFYNNSSVTPSIRNFTNQSFKWDFGDNTPPVIMGANSIVHVFPGPGRYVVKLTLIDSNFCNAPLDTSQMISVDFTVKAGFKTASHGCSPYNATFENLSITADKVLWNFGDGTTSTETNPVHLYSTPGNYTVKLVAMNDFTCNRRDTAWFNITVNPKPVAGFIFSPDPPQENTAVDFANTSTGADMFVWRFGDGESFITRTYDNVQHSYNETNTFTPCLVASTIPGCADTVCRSLRASVLPLLDVPNAFTPNGDGINDKVFVRGFGIQKMWWRIYNRWGAVVFETTDKNQGWDGKYKGSLQPQEVYHYVLDVEYVDKTKVSRKGDITLLR